MSYSADDVDALRYLENQMNILVQHSNEFILQLESVDDEQEKLNMLLLNKDTSNPYLSWTIKLYLKRYGYISSCL